MTIQEKQRQKAPKQSSVTDPHPYNSLSRRRLLMSAAAIGAGSILGAAASRWRKTPESPNLGYLP